MTETNKHLTEAQQKAAAFLTRQKPGTAAWRAAKDAADIANAKVGDIMQDGSIYAGMLPETHERIFIAAKDTPCTMSFNEAAKYAEDLDVHGHKDWRMPTLDELNLVYQNIEKGALRETFNRTVEGSAAGGYPGWYWTSTPLEDIPMWVKTVCFSDGHAHHEHQEDGGPLSARPVRLVIGVKR